MPTREQLIARGMARCRVEKKTSHAGIGGGAGVFVAIELDLTPGFRPDDIIGIEYDPLHPDDTIDAAEAAIVRKFWAELPALSLTSWIERTAKAFTVTPPGEKKRRADSGKSRLAAAILGLPYDAATLASKPHKALLRALQRAGAAVKPGRKQAHVSVDKQYRDLIDRYANSINPGSSPFGPGGAVDIDRLDYKLPNLGVSGEWQISERHYDPRALHTSSIVEYNPETMRRARAVARNDGRDFIETVIYHVSEACHGTTVALLRADTLMMQAGVPI